MTEKKRKAAKKIETKRDVVVEDMDKQQLKVQDYSLLKMGNFNKDLLLKGGHSFFSTWEPLYVLERIN